jgi:hypothetical protein
MDLTIGTYVPTTGICSKPAATNKIDIPTHILSSGTRISNPGRKECALWPFACSLCAGVGVGSSAKGVFFSNVKKHHRLKINFLFALQAG